MRISDSEVKRILAQTQEGKSHPAIVEEILTIGIEADLRKDKELVDQVVEIVQQMPDRDEVIADLRSRIESGTYNPSGADIADAMIRRTIADRVR